MQDYLLNDLMVFNLDLAAISEAGSSDSQAIAPIFDDYDLFSSCGLSGADGSVAVLFRKSSGLEVNVIFLVQDDILVVLDVNGSEGGDLRLAVDYASIGARREEFFRRLEIFLGTSHSLILVGVPE